MSFGLSPTDKDILSEGPEAIIGDFAEVASSEGHGVWASVSVMPPVVVESPDVTVVPLTDSSRDGGQSPVSFGLSPTDKDTLSEEPEVIVVGDVGTGTPWFLTRWAEGTSL